MGASLNMVFRHPLCWTLLFFAAALLPRLSLIVLGVSYADDWVYDPFAHIQSYRPFAALEQWVLHWLLGEHYLTTWVPKVFAAAGYAIGLAFLMEVLNRLGVARKLFGIIAIVTLLHPAFNELILWGILSSMGLAFALVGYGLWLIYCVNTRNCRALGVLFLSLAALANQLYAPLAATLVVIELLGVKLLQRSTLSPRFWLPRLSMCITPIFISVVALVVIRYWFGIEDFAGRTISFGSGPGSSFFAAKFYVFSNAYANLFQAPAGVLLGVNLALKLFWPMVLVPFAVAVLLLAFRVPMVETIMLAILLPLVFFLSLSPLAATNATPSGFRLIPGTLLFLAIAWSVILSSIWHNYLAKIFIVGVCFGTSILFLWTSQLDNVVRKDAWQQDDQWLTDAQTLVETLSLNEVQLCRWGFSLPAKSKESSKGILVGYNVTEWFHYSIWYRQFLGAFLRRHQMPVLSNPSLTPLDRCESQCTMNNAESKNFGPFSLRIETDNNAAIICER